ncbi:glutamate-cysteine ligase [Halohasta litchfieldiae]|uniref:Glutamate-cysteine ligase family 2(GCS2) n=1 Tax=Halohasta litchfieldiae TaxID=1073996 RepID=A0A1H6RQA9_9EURY|nr:glutamate-cysteine ligase [Halohasta litchfieldiae]SEI54010.1 Glutamate-cysteine ligase family 2(GCS2) [Halohasta litchfieldiae]
MHCPYSIYVNSTHRVATNLLASTACRRGIETVATLALLRRNRLLECRRCSITVTAHQSTSVRRSIEVEYWVIDEAGRLVEPDGLIEASPGAEREFVEPMIEIKTTPCESTAELRRELCGRIRTVLQRAAELDKGLVPLSTPITHEAIQELPSERTRIQNEVIGEDFEYVRHCAGTHIHFEQQPGHAVDQLNTLIALDPALALVNSGRHFRGETLAMGARSELYRRLAYDGLAHQGELWPYVADCAEWTDRLEARYDEFLQTALAAGVDRTAVESCFDPESAVWTPVQLREEFGTVEWRSPDTAYPSEILRLSDQMATIIDGIGKTELRIGGENGSITDKEIVLPTFDAVSEYVDAAIEEGLASESVRSYLTRMGFDVEAYEPIAHEVQDGYITQHEARQLRVEYADRLRVDILQTQPLEAD